MLILNQTTKLDKKARREKLRRGPNSINSSNRGTFSKLSERKINNLSDRHNPKFEAKASFQNRKSKFVSSKSDINSVKSKNLRRESDKNNGK